MNILCIGNSFSEDATRYLHSIFLSRNEKSKVVNMMIGGCPLSYHYNNMLTDKPAYDFMFNGEYTGLKVSLSQALSSEAWNEGWDYITLQQVSHKAPFYDTYEPYLTKLVEYIRTFSPKSKICIHQTWAYEENSQRLTKELNYHTSKDMLNDIISSYEKAAKSINAHMIIPSGKLMYNLHQNGIDKIHRDTFHASFGASRFALALLFYKSFTGNDINNIVVPFDEPISQQELEIIRKTVNEL